MTYADFVENFKYMAAVLLFSDSGKFLTSLTPPLLTKFFGQDLGLGIVLPKHLIFILLAAVRFLNPKIHKINISGQSSGATPVPISNTEVKPVHVLFGTASHAGRTESC